MDIVETPPVEVSEAPVAEPVAPKSEPVAKSFLALQAKENALRKQSEEFKTAQTELESWKGLSASAKENPTAILEKFGLTLDDLISHTLGSQEEPDAPVTALEKRLAKMEEEREGYLSKAVEAEKAQALDVVHDAIENVLADTEKYEMILGTGSKQLVFDTLLEIWGSTGEVPDLSEVASYIEGELEAQAFQASQYKKVQNRLNPVKESESKHQGDSAGVYGSKTSGLTPSTIGEVNIDTMSDDERIQYAVAQLKKQNKGN